MVAVGGCDSNPDDPTKPSPTLMVATSSTETLSDGIAWRVELRLRVTDGLNALAEAVQSGDGRIEVCDAEMCAEDILGSSPMMGPCQTAVGAGAVEIEAAWLDGEEVGINFCVPASTTAATYEITLSAGAQQSNIIETACSLDGAALSCVSG